jgi:alpha-galactosidase
VRLFLGGGCSAFAASVGVDDESGQGSVTFEVWGDGTRLLASDVLHHGTPAAPVAVDVTGVQVLDLRVTDGGDGVNFDHADWAAPVITC